MSAHTQILEHRWRVRGLDAPAELRLGPQVSALATVREAGLNGALIQTGARLALDSRIALRPIPEAGVWLDARVIRLTEHGATLKWVKPRLDYLAILLTESMK